MCVALYNFAHTFGSQEGRLTEAVFQAKAEAALALPGAVLSSKDMNLASHDCHSSWITA